MAALKQGYNDLLTWCKNNGERGQRLLDEYMEQKNFDELGKIMNEFIQGSTIKVWWKCSKCSFEWKTEPKTRINGQNCPACSHKVVYKGYNDLYTWCQNNGERGQQLIDEYMEEKNFNELGKSMNEFTSQSHTKLWWQCKDCNYEWQAAPHSRVGSNTNCPWCNKKDVSKGRNDLETWCHKEENQAWGELLLKEWDYEANAAEGNYIDTVSYGSQKKMHWICSNEKCNEKFDMRVSDRTIVKCRCNKCTSQGTSYPEQFIYRSLNQVYEDVLCREPLYKSKEKPRGYEYDIYIPKLSLVIEYGSDYHHGKIQKTEKKKQDKLKEDREKREKALSEGLTFIEIIQTDDESKQPEQENQYIILNKNVNPKGLKTLVRMLFPEESKHIDFIEADRQAIAHSRGKVEEEKQLQNTHPMLCLDWDYEKNELGPEFYTYGSGESVHWKCHICKKSYVQSIHDRAKRTCCPECGYDSKTKKINKDTAKLLDYRKLQRERKENAKNFINFI